MATTKKTPFAPKGHKKKTSIGNSPRTKSKQPGPHGGNRGYKKKYRGQG